MLRGQKLNKKNFYIVIWNLLSICVLVSSSLSYHNTIANNISPINSKTSVSPEDLFLRDPTNPTQVLKAELNQKRDQLVNFSPKVSNEKEFSDALDDERSFWTIQSFSSYPYTYIQITATLLAVGEHSYVYVANSIINSEGKSEAQSKAETYRDEFDDVIYPSDTLYFGSPDGYLGDIDGDPKVTMLLLSLDGGVAGYFDPINEYVDSNSNQREMIYVDYGISDIQYSFAVIAHEFQHLIHFNHDQDELWFIDEGCSEFATYAAGYWAGNDNLTYFAEDNFANNPEDSLLYWNYDSEGGYDVRIDYGGAYLFIFYLAEKYGFQIIETLVAETTNGAQGVENALVDEEIPLTFNDLYLNWITALTIDAPEIGEGLYGFVNLDIQIKVETEISNVPTESNNELHRYYGIHVTKITSGSDNIFFEISGSDQYAIGFSIAILDSEGWHINQSISDVSTESKMEIIQGKDISRIYAITSLLDSDTPFVDSDNQFGLGPYEYLNLNLYVGNPLTIKNVQATYEKDTWTYIISGARVYDVNNTELDDTSQIEVFLEFKGSEGFKMIKSLNYSDTDYWNGQLSLQSFSEDTYSVKLFAKNSSAFGKINLADIVVEHIITVEKPSVEILGDYLVITIGASYTQLNGWENFTKYAEVKAVIYDLSTGTPADVINLVYDSGIDKWTSGSYYYGNLTYGDYYVSVTFKYGYRTVSSDSSEIFSIETEDTTTPNFTPFPLVSTTLAIVTLVAVIAFKKQK